jgi:hypothetical protein
MKQTVMKKWVKALRSGKYTQGKNALHTRAGGYCCLGVLCDLAAQEGKGKWEGTTDDGDQKFLDRKGNHESSYLPIVVQDWAGVNSKNPVACGVLLSGMNDEGRSFGEIADVIEKNWRTL